MGVLTALYIRLSREDGSGRESNSVATQRAILTSYARRAGICEYREYVDDGYTGTTTARPALCRLLADIAAGQVDTVMVKDLSRLARNSADSNALLDEFFPLHGVRFISVGEGIDTACEGAGTAFAPLANMMHEFYSRDISGKIRAALYAKMDEGRFVGARAPMGYTARDGVLYPDERAATVRKVFALAAAGGSCAEISRTVGITPERVRAVIKDPVYLGRLEQGKTRKLSFKSRISVSVPPQGRHVTENAHQPLVSRALFDAANKALAKRSRVGSGFENIFSGLAYCADCGSRMSTVGTRRAGSPCALACGGYKRGGASACTNHHIDYLTLCDAVRGALRSAVPTAEELCGRTGAPLEACRELAGFNTLDSSLLFALIERIEVYQGTRGKNREQQVRIHFRFSASC